MPRRLTARLPVPPALPPLPNSPRNSDPTPRQAQDKLWRIEQLLDTAEKRAALPPLASFDFDAHAPEPDEVEDARASKKQRKSSGSYGAYAVR